MNTKRVIQNLKIIDVPSSYSFCLCCGLWKDGRLAKRLPGFVSGGVCSACVLLPEDEQGRGIAAFRKQRATSQYYSLSCEVETYQAIVGGGMTVGKLISRLQALDPKAYVIIRYNDPDEGEVLMQPDPSEQDEIMGVPYYRL